MNTWRLNNRLLNNEEINEEIKEEIKNTYKQMTVKSGWLKTMGCSKSNPKGEANSNSVLPQEMRKISSEQLNIIPKAATPRRANKTQSY